MKTYPHLLALIIGLAPATLFAQVSIKGSAYKPEDFSHVLDSISTLKRSFSAHPSTSNPNNLNFQLPVGPGHIKENAKKYDELEYRYNMPIAKLENTSKILIATLDPEFPYHYNMPIKKLRIAEEDRPIHYDRQTQ